MADVAVDRLAEVVGTDGVRTGAAAGPWAVHGRAPAAVVAPSDAEQAAEVLALASAEGWTVEPAGGGTALDAGRPPERVDLVLTTERLTEIAEYEPADLTASVGAGLPLAVLAARLDEHGQWLALDPPAGPGATVGAVAATASAGPLRYGHGTPRRHVLGLEVVTGDGRIARFGGRVVKNVAGYDLTKPIVGSRGTLGLITRVNLRLRPRPRRDVTLALRSADGAAAVDAVRSVREARIEPVALELLSPALAARSLRSGDGWALLLRAQGVEDAVDDLVDRVRGLSVGRTAETLPDERAAELWPALGAGEAGAALVVRLAGAASALDETLALATSCLERAGHDRSGGGSAEAGRREGPDVDPDGGARTADALIAAHAGDGTVRLLVDSPRRGEAAADAWREAIDAARREMAARGGTVIVTRAPRLLADRVDPFGDAGKAIALMRELKREFDPAGILAPGRYVV